MYFSNMIECKKMYEDWTVLSYPEWKKEYQQHRNELEPILAPYLEKRSHGEKNPVIDFFFEYYSFRPGHLMTWTPGIGYLLEKEGQDPEMHFKEIHSGENYLYLDPSAIPAKRLRSFEWILKLLEACKFKDPAFGCFGMHEWAMVYNTEEVRHDYLPFRLPRKEINKFVESRPLVCTHFDAFRFFTEPAKPMNKFEPDRERFQLNEQPGCLHTNMDLYKWAFKAYPWIPGNLLRKAFQLALDARKMDMMASPYDLSGYGYKPIKIETEKGRKEYLSYQKAIYSRSMDIRDELIAFYQKLINFSLIHKY